jgi:hypothetical protein
VLAAISALIGAIAIRTLLAVGPAPAHTPINRFQETLTHKERR